MGRENPSDSTEALQITLPLLTNAGVRAEAELAVKKIEESIKGRYPESAQAASQEIEAK